MSSPTSPATAVVVSGGKQFRVAPGDRILVDRVAAEPGSDLTLDHVLLWRDGDEVKVTGEELQGVTVSARVLDHRRGPKIDVLRYKPKKRVRVHRGSRAELTELEIVSVGTSGTDEKTSSSRGRRRTKEPAGDSGASSPSEGAASSSQEGD